MRVQAGVEEEEKKEQDGQDSFNKAAKTTGAVHFAMRFAIEFAQTYDDVQKVLVNVEWSSFYP
jgi:hypothetical protein